MISVKKNICFQKIHKIVILWSHDEQLVLLFAQIVLILS